MKDRLTLCCTCMCSYRCRRNTASVSTERRGCRSLWDSSTEESLAV